jgi:hypothetical protein
MELQILPPAIMHNINNKKRSATFYDLKQIKRANMSSSNNRHELDYYQSLEAIMSVSTAGLNEFHDIMRRNKPITPIKLERIKELLISENLLNIVEIERISLQLAALRSAGGTAEQQLIHTQCAKCKEPSFLLTICSNCGETKEISQLNSHCDW